MDRYHNELTAAYNASRTAFKRLQKARDNHGHAWNRITKKLKIKDDPSPIWPLFWNFGAGDDAYHG